MILQNIIDTEAYFLTTAMLTPKWQYFIMFQGAQFTDNIQCIKVATPHPF